MNGPTQLSSHGGADSEMFLYLAKDGTLWAMSPGGTQVQISTGNGGPPAPTGIPEAPSDGLLYGRYNATWEKIPEVPPEKIKEAPTDGEMYARQDGDWTPVPPEEVTEAPDDGRLYARQNRGWQMFKPQSAAPRTHRSFILTNNGNQITLSIGEHGDLWVTQQEGPNAGKSVDLTYGKWQ